MWYLVGLLGSRLLSLTSLFWVSSSLYIVSTSCRIFSSLWAKLLLSFSSSSKRHSFWGDYGFEDSPEDTWAMICTKESKQLVKNNNLMHPLMCITRLFSKWWKRLKFAQGRFELQRVYTWYQHFKWKRSKLLSLAHQRFPNKTLRKFKDRQEKLKERKLNQNGIRMMTKFKQDKQEKHYWRLKETYLNF